MPPLAPQWSGLRKLRIFMVLVILNTFRWADRAHTLGFWSTHGYYKTIKYGPHRPAGRLSKIVKTTKFFCAWGTNLFVPEAQISIFLRNASRFNMPRLKSTDTHDCIICGVSYKRRPDLRKHLTSLTKKGKPRCPGLKVVIPSDVWTQEIIPHYCRDAPMPNLGMYQKQTPRKRKKLKALGSRKQMKNRTDKIFKSVCIAADELELGVPELLGLLLTRCTTACGRIQ